MVLSTLAVAATLSWLFVELARGGIPWTPAFFAALALLWVLARRRPGTLWKDRPATAAFLTLVAVYLSTFRWHGGDDAPNSLIPFCLLRYKTLTLDPVLSPWFIGKMDSFTVPFGPHRLSVYPIIPGILAVPLYILPIAAGVAPSEQFLHNLSKLSGSMITALSAAVLYRVAAKRCSREWALCLTGLYGLGSWAFSVSSQALWQHGPAQLGAALGLWGLSRTFQEGFSERSTVGRKASDDETGNLGSRWHMLIRKVVCSVTSQGGGEGALFWWSALASFGFALSFAARPDSIFFLAAAGAFVLFHERRRLPGFALGAAGPLAFLAFYWLHYTGHLKPPESQFQASIFAGFDPRALLGLLFSPTRGLLFFFPAAVFGIWAGLRRWRDPKTFWLLLACAGPWILLSFYSNWVGGMTYGPRYFAVVALMMAYFCADADFEQKIRSNRKLLTAWAATVSACILVHALGGYLTWPGSQDIAAEKANVWSWSLHPVAQLFAADGSLGKLAAPARGAVGFSVLGFFTFLAGRIRKTLT